MLLFAASTNLSYRTFTRCKWEIHIRICQGFHKIRFYGGPTFTNSATDWKIVMQQRAWFCAVCVSAPKRFGLVLYDVINYNNVISATDLYESVKNYW